MALPVLTPGADGLNRPEPRLLAGRMLGSGLDLGTFGTTRGTSWAMNVGYEFYLSKPSGWPIAGSTRCYALLSISLTLMRTADRVDCLPRRMGCGLQNTHFAWPQK